MPESNGNVWTNVQINEAQGRVQHILRQATFILHTLPSDPTFFSQLPAQQQQLDNLLEQYSCLRPSIPPPIFYRTIQVIDSFREDLTNRERQGPPPLFRHSPPVVRSTNGRRKYEVLEDKVKRMHREGKTVRFMAFVLGVSPRTLNRWKRTLRLKAGDRKTVISDDAVERLVVRIRSQGNQSLGEVGMITALRIEGAFLPQAQVRRALQSVDGPGRHARWQQIRKRRRYAVPFPPALVHIDGLHLPPSLCQQTSSDVHLTCGLYQTTGNLKLVRWLFVLHGGIDGYSRRIFYLQAATNDEASTVLRAFQSGVARLGWPSRLRADYGGENLRVKDPIEDVKGKNRGKSSPVFAYSLYI